MTTVWLIDEFGHGGIGRYAVDVANLLDDASAVVATSSLGPVHGLRGRAVEWFPRPADTRAARALGGVVGLVRAARSVRRGDIAWVPLGIRPAFELALCVVLLARRATLVVTIHNRGPHGRGQSRSVLRAARLARSVVVHTAALEHWAAESGLRSVRLPFPPPDVETGGADGLTRQALGIPDARLVVSLLGYLHHYKGVDVLVEAVARARRSSPQLAAHVLIAGRPPGGGAVLAALESAAQDPHITVRAGWLQEAELSALLALTDVVVLPYREIDNSGSGSLARSRGLPAIASDLPGLREIFGHAAVYVPPGDPDALADALVRLPSLLPELQREAAAAPDVDLASDYRGFLRGLRSGPSAGDA